MTKDDGGPVGFCQGEELLGNEALALHLLDQNVGRGGAVGIRLSEYLRDGGVLLPLSAPAGRAGAAHAEDPQDSGQPGLFRNLGRASPSLRDQPGLLEQIVRLVGVFGTDEMARELTRPGAPRQQVVQLRAGGGLAHIPSRSLSANCWLARADC
jgi:hypothetical protein